ncbi:MAG: uracil phosphoribosyltransferase [Rikenellaceae bacterium]
MIRILDEQKTIMNQFVAELRDFQVQKDSMRFRRNLERVGEIMAYEISKTLEYKVKQVETPLGISEIELFEQDDIVVATILRAGIPFHQGFLNYFDKASSAFISAYRKYSKDLTFNINIDSISCGDLVGKTLIIADPMLATGHSFVVAYDALIKKAGMPKHTHVAAVISSAEGVEYVRRHTDSATTTIWSASVDQELTVKSYIIPGIGDAGDLAYGDKM